MLTDEGVGRFRSLAEGYVADGTVPGMVAVVASGEDVFLEAFGAMAEAGPPMRTDTLFRIASTTKPITAAATLALVAEGRLELNEPVDRLLPELAHRRVLVRMDAPLSETVPAARAITVRDLLTFSFGFGMAVEMFFAETPWPITRACAELNLATLGPPDPQVPPAPDEWIGRLGSLPLLAQPGERWLYNTGAQVLGVLCARAAGTSYPEVLATRVLEPLGMGDTSFWTSETGRLATGYRPTAGGLVLSDPSDGEWSRPPSFPDGAAGLLSTGADLLAFARMLLRGGAPVLPAELVAEMVRDQLSDAQKGLGGLGPDFFADRGWGFCLAVATGGSRIGEVGWDGGLGVTWRVNLARDLVVIVMTQRMFEGGEPPKLHDDLQAAAYAALG